MLRGLPRLVWLEIKIFVREPLGVIGTIVIPVAVFIVLSRLLGESAAGALPRSQVPFDLAVFASLLIIFGAVQSLVAIMAIYRESGILKRLRATPLRPPAILTAHVVVKLLFTALTLMFMVAAGRRYGVMGAGVPLLSFGLALLFSTVSILSLGFLIASIVPTARFAQPICTIILYPMLGISGLFFPIAALPPAMQVVAHLLPPTYAVSLLGGIWHGDPWLSHGGDVAALALTFVVFTSIASRVFRWE